jgi:hypothetical protein
MRRLVLSVLSPAFLAACQPATTELTEEKKAEIAATVDSLMDEWLATFEAVGLDESLSFLSDSPEMTWASDGDRTVYSVAEAREVWGSHQVGVQRTELEITNARTVVLAPDIVWTLREMDYTVVDTAGAITAEGKLKETTVWVKRNGEWKVLLGQDSDVTASP